MDASHVGQRSWKAVLIGLNIVVLMICAVFSASSTIMPRPSVHHGSPATANSKKPKYEQVVSISGLSDGDLVTHLRAKAVWVVLSRMQRLEEVGATNNRTHQNKTEPDGKGKVRQRVHTTFSTSLGGPSDDSSWESILFSPVLTNETDGTGLQTKTNK